MGNIFQSTAAQEKEQRRQDVIDFDLLAREPRMFRYSDTELDTRIESIYRLFLDDNAEQPVRVMIGEECWEDLKEKKDSFKTMTPVGKRMMFVAALKQSAAWMN